MSSNPSSPSKKNDAARSPLHSLCQQKEFKEPEVQELRLLLHTGAQPQVVDGFGRSPLGLLCEVNGSHEAAEVLLQAGADINAQDDWGRTPLHWCCDRGWLQTARLLVEHGAAINRVTNHGDSPLLWAAKAGRAPLVEMLVAAGADPFLRNNRGEGPSAVAANEDVRAILSAYEDQLRATDDSEARVVPPTSTAPKSVDEQKAGPSSGAFSAYAKSSDAPVAATGVGAPKRLKISLKKKPG